MQARNRVAWRHVLLVAVAACATWAGNAAGQDKYPAKAIEIIVPFAPGGSTDLSARTTAGYITKRFGATVNIVNKPGARGIPQTQELHRAAPDGYTLLAENPATNSMLAAAMGKDLPFDNFERTYLGMNTGTAFTVIVHPNSPYKTLKELLDDARRNPERISWTSQGSTGMTDYFTRMMFSRSGVDIAKTPALMVQGTGVVMAAGGNVVMGLSSASGALAGIKSGIVRALVISSAERDPDFPGVPTTVELGLPVVISWNGLSAPPKTPKHIVAFWEKALEDSTKDPEFVANLKKVGAAPLFHNSAGMQKYIRDEVDQASKLFSGATK